MNTDILLCECHSDEHQMLIHYDTEDGEVYLHIHLVKRSFWYRLWYAVKYVLGYKSKFGAWDEFIFRQKDAGSLQLLADFVRSEKDIDVLIQAARDRQKQSGHPGEWLDELRGRL